MLSAAARQLIEEVKQKGLWIYEPDYKRWYTPEEFEHILSYANASDEFLKKLQLRNPMEGIQAGHKI